MHAGSQTLSGRETFTWSQQCWIAEPPLILGINPLISHFSRISTCSRAGSELHLPPTPTCTSPPVSIESKCVSPHPQFAASCPSQRCFIRCLHGCLLRIRRLMSQTGGKASRTFISSPHSFFAFDFYVAGETRLFTRLCLVGLMTASSF